MFSWVNDSHLQKHSQESFAVPDNADEEFGPDPPMKEGPKKGKKRKAGKEPIEKKEKKPKKEKKKKKGKIGLEDVQVFYRFLCISNFTGCQQMTTLLSGLHWYGAPNIDGKSGKGVSRSGRESATLTKTMFELKDGGPHTSGRGRLAKEGRCGRPIAMFELDLVAPTQL